MAHSESADQTASLPEAGQAPPLLTRQARRLVAGVAATVRPATDEDRNVLLLYANMALHGIVAAGATAYLSVFAVRLGASAMLVGLLISLPALVMVLSAVPAGRLVARQPRLVPLVTRSNTALALAYVVIALVPWLAPAWAGAAIVAIWAVAAIPTGIAEVSMTAAMAEAVPAHRRATVVSTRFAIHACVAAAALPLIGRALDTLPFPTGYQVVFLASFVAAMLSVRVISRLRLPDQPAPQPAPQPAADEPSPWTRAKLGLRELRSQSPFMRYLLPITLFRLGMCMPRPLFSIFWVRNLDLSDGDIGLATTIVYILSVVGFFLWGYVANRHGHGPVLLLSTLGLAAYPFIMALANGLAPVLLASCFGGLFSSGLSLATFNVLLALAPPDRRANYIALNTVSVYSMSLIGPMLGSALGGAIGIREALMVGAALRFVGGVLFVVRPVRE